MGMAASQARFLGLTARKTNTEYEGQQINQQRTTLANQSANYYNQLLGMSVPVPPSVADYTKTTYSFTDGALNNTITALMAQKDGSYLISYTTSWQNDFAVISASPSIYTRTEKKSEEEEEKEPEADNNDKYDYYVGGNKLRPLGSGLGVKGSEGEEEAAVEEEEEFKTDDPYLKGLSKEQREALQKEEEHYKALLKEKYGEDAEWLVRYVQNKSTGTWVPQFVDKKVLDSENTIYNENGASQSYIPTYTIGTARETEEIKNVNARLEQDATGRIINITLNPGQDNEVTYAVTTNTVTDQAKYDDAMNQYEYDKYQYDQSIQEINAKIEIVQAEDKNLELRLKQLDTEQDAIQNEMDAVQKVIEKNTESTFKTFG